MKTNKFNLLRAADMIKTAPIKVLLYGDSGAGKTTLAVTAPRPLVLLTEFQAIPSINASNPEAVVLPCQTVQDIQSVIDAIKAKDPQFKVFDTLIIDSLTEAQRIIKDDILSRARRTQMQMQDWGTLAEATRRLIRDLRDLDINVICTALMEHETEESTGKRFVNPIFEGRKTNKEIAQWFTVIGCIYRKDSKDEEGRVLAQRHVMIDGPDNILCKSTPPLDGVLIDVSLTDVFNQIHEHNKPKPEPESIKEPEQEPEQAPESIEEPKQEPKQEPEEEPEEEPKTDERMLNLTKWANNFGGIQHVYSLCEDKQWPTPDQWDQERTDRFINGVLNGSIEL